MSRNKWLPEIVLRASDFGKSRSKSWRVRRRKRDLSSGRGELSTTYRVLQATRRLS